MRLMKLSGCNAMSIGIFSWSALEPTEEQFEFGLLVPWQQIDRNVGDDLPSA